MFGTKRPAITKLLSDIYREGELDGRGTRSIFGTYGAVTCNKTFSAAEYGAFVAWASVNLSPEDFERIPAWGEVKDWPGKVVGCCDYEARAAASSRPPYHCGGQGRPPYQCGGQGRPHYQCGGQGLTAAAALKVDAKAIILAHNHPSGNPMPSVQDYELTAALVSLGDQLGVKVLDHLVIGGECCASALPE